MSKPLTEFKQKAIDLRKQGLSYKEIKEHIPVAKSSLSLWLKGIPLSDKDRMRLYTKNIHLLSRGSQSQKERRKREIETILVNARKEIQIPLSNDTFRLLGAALYWAEGNKTGTMGFTNSDPHLILFFVRWMNKVFEIPAKNLKGRLNIYSQQNDLELKKFWSDLTGIPVAHFGKSFVKPANKGFKKNNLYYGTMRVEVPKSVDMKHRIFGWIQAALQEVEKTTKIVQRKWQSLTEVQRPVNLR